MEALTAAQIREQILGADDLKKEPLILEEWGITEEMGVCVRELTGSQRDEYETSVVKVSGEGKVRVDQHDMRAKLCAMSIVAADGTLPFTQEDVLELGAKSATALDKVTDTAMRLSRIGVDEVEALGND